MALEIILTAAAGVITTIGSSLGTWLFSKKKYNSEVDSNNIQNMQQALDFYIKISDDYKQRLQDEIESHNKEVAEIKVENAELKRELKEQRKEFDEKLAEQQKEITMMKNQMLSVYSQVCMNFNCIERNPMKNYTRKPKTHYKKEKVENDEKVQIPETTD